MSRSAMLRRVARSRAAAAALLCLAAATAGCGTEPPPLPYPRGSIVAVEADAARDRDGDRPAALPRVADRGRIEAFIDAVNRHARRVRPEGTPRVDATLHLVRNGKPKIDIGISAPRESETVGLVVGGAFYAARRSELADPLRGVGLELPTE